MPPLMFHHFSGHLPRTRKLCKFCKMMDQNFQTKPINPATKILVICLGKTVFPLTLPKHFHFCRNCQTFNNFYQCLISSVICFPLPRQQLWTHEETRQRRRFSLQRENTGKPLRHQSGTLQWKGDSRSLTT